MKMNSGKNKKEPESREFHEENSPSSVEATTIPSGQSPSIRETQELSGCDDHSSSLCETQELSVCEKQNPSVCETQLTESMEKLALDLMNINMRYSKEISQIAEYLSATGEYGILHYLYRENRIFSAGELAEALGLSPGRIANVLKALERKKLIIRERDSQDRRRIHVSLTDFGKKSLCKLHDQATEMHRSLVREIGEQDARDFIRITRKLFAIISNSKI